VIPDTIGNLIQLKELYLYDNALSVIPDTIGNLIQLEGLNLSGNKLSVIPDTIGNLIQLKELSLYNNALSVIPDTIGNLLQLEELDLNSNKLSAIPNTIRNFIKKKELFRIDLISNPLNLNLKSIWTINDNIDDFPSWFNFIKRCSENTLKYLHNIYNIKLNFCLGFNEKIGSNSSIYKDFYNNQNLFDINLIPLIFQYIAKIKNKTKKRKNKIKKRKLI
jgi:Leucine-rich repeat (LRR) protein